MGKEIKVVANKRAKGGSSESRRLRVNGVVPAVIYNDKAESNPIQINGHDFTMLMRGHGNTSLLMTMDLDGVEKKVLVREVQRHPVSGNLVHVDFFEVSMTKKMRVDLPLRFTGEPVGVTIGGGVLQHLLRMVTVECLPADLPEEVTIDVTNLVIGQSLSVGDIVLDPKIALITAKDVAVATVTEQKVEEEAKPAEGEVVAASTAEPEVIIKKKEGEEAEAGEKKPGGKEKK
ncbi:MAG: 50S ribosomal protein L25 [Kiritimatiellia bacterium]